MGIINDAIGVPSSMSYVKYFGSLRKAFALIGHKSPRDCDWIDSQQHWTDELAARATQVADALNREKHIVAKVNGSSAISVNRTIKICFQIARQTKKRGPNPPPGGSIARKAYADCSSC
jgi:hypothetical protein